MSARELFVPGRLCLFGEHSDWAGVYRALDASITAGYCLAVGTTQGITARVARNDSQLIVDSRAVDDDLIPLAIPFTADRLGAVAHSENFYAYVAGVALHMREHYRIGNITIQTTRMNLPLRKGLSSSAAICVLAARAFNQLYALELSTRDEMECAYQGEILTGSQCGRLDQVCAYGSVPVSLVFDGEQMHVEPVAPRAPMHLVIVDLQRGKDTKKILHDLNCAFVSKSPIGAQVRDALGTQNKRIVSQAHSALEGGDAQRLGELMCEAQQIFDRQVAPASADELSAPKLHDVLAHPLVRELSWGGKGVGSQGDGCAQLVAHDSEAQQALLRELPPLLDVSCLELNIVALQQVREGVAV